MPRPPLAGLQANDRWWLALQTASDELAAASLYVTHLFDEEQIILCNDWRGQGVDAPDPGLRFLALRRPATIDLVLTKMMRGPDPEDMQDVRFYLEREPAIGVDELHEALRRQSGRTSPRSGSSSRPPSLSC